MYDPYQKVNELLSGAQEDPDNLRAFCIALLDLWNEGVEQKYWFECGETHPSKYVNYFTTFYHSHKKEIQKVLYPLAHVDLSKCPMISLKSNIFAGLAAGSLDISFKGFDFHDWPLDGVPSEFVMNAFFNDVDFMKLEMGKTGHSVEALERSTYIPRLPLKICEHCRTEFEQRIKSQKFCNKNCQRSAKTKRQRLKE